jgi:hypothetical protein
MSANLQGAKLPGANLRSAKMQFAQLKNAGLYGTQLRVDAPNPFNTDKSKTRILGEFITNLEPQFDENTISTPQSQINKHWQVEDEAKPLLNHLPKPEPPTR